MEKINTANDQQVIEVIKMDKLYDEIQNFEEPIKNLEILLAKNNFLSTTSLKKKQS